MEEGVHQQQAVGVLHQLDADVGAGALELLLGLGEREVVVGERAHVAVGGDEEAAGAGGRVLHDLAGPRLDEGDHAVDQGARGEVLAGARLLLGGVLLEQALVEVAEALGAGGVPVEGVDLLDQLAQDPGLLDGGVGAGEDLLDELRALGAEVDEQLAVELELVDPVPGLEVVPALALAGAARSGCRSPCAILRNSR